ncbi:MAG: NifB/NifX family molybdenum-iron cluster-binding protein [Candidatus Methanomethyliaceae archaeon]
MKIAIVTDDGINVSRHFGRAPYYLVLELEENDKGKKTIKERKLVPKLGHGQFHGLHDGGGEGLHMGSEMKHRAIVSPILDCKVVICGGMGMGAYQSLMLNGIRPIITTIEDAEAAVEAYLNGRIDDHPEVLH